MFSLSTAALSPASGSAGRILRHLSRSSRARRLFAVIAAMPGVHDHQVDDLDDEVVRKVLGRDRGVSHYPERATIRRLVSILREVGIVKVETPRSRTPVQACLQEYRDYLVRDRGLPAACVPNYLSLCKCWYCVTNPPKTGEIEGSEVKPKDRRKLWLARCYLEFFPNLREQKNASQTAPSTTRAFPPNSLSLLTKSISYHVCYGYWCTLTRYPGLVTEIPA
jgi:hypothetical protein